MYGTKKMVKATFFSTPTSFSSVGRLIVKALEMLTLKTSVIRECCPLALFSNSEYSPIEKSSNVDDKQNWQKTKVNLPH
jgi:hypothetical protein